MRPAAITVATASLLTCSCGMFGLSDEEERKLSFYQSESATYYDAGRYAQALTLIEKGLAIAPADYKLLAKRAWCHLQQSEQQPELLDVCEQEFADLWATRRPRDHGIPVLLGQGETQRRIGLRHWERSRVLRDEARAPDRSESERALLDAEASEHEVAADYHFEKSERALQQLIDNELALRIANRRLMDLAVVRNEYENAVAHGLKFLEYNHREQQRVATLIEETPEVQVEREARLRYQEITDEEMRVRTALAEMHYRQGELDACLAQLDALIEMDPTRSTDYYNRARVLEALGRTEDARRDFEKFLSSTRLPVGHEKVTHAFEFTRKHRPNVPADS